jgi:hypothetical protein
MAKRWNTLQEAFHYVNEARRKDKESGDMARLWTILATPSGGHYAYLSDRNFGQQMHNIASLILGYRNEFQLAAQRAPAPAAAAGSVPAAAASSVPAAVPAAAPALPKLLQGEGEKVLPPDNLHRNRPFVQAMAEAFKDKAIAAKSVRFGGHAEEFMIQDFARVLRDEQDRAASSSPAARPKSTPQFLVLNSDSPCTTGDKGGSSNLAGWPPSCMAKLVELADQNPDFEFVVFFLRRYGKLDEGSKQAVARARQELTKPGQKPGKEEVAVLAERYRNQGVAQFLKGLAGANRGAARGHISIYPFTGELKQNSEQFADL